MSDIARQHRVGMVIIGRNEGERLVRCVDSLIGSHRTLVYVDSGSTDDSVPMATQRGVRVVQLDMSQPFSAARARNEGFARLVEYSPDVEYVQFVDGDCEMSDTWIDRAVNTLSTDERVVAVCGRLHERYPERSIYNALCNLEWDRPSGQVDACGGIFMIQRDAFEAVGGFDPTVPAGEEPELCQRLREQGGTIMRLPDTMGYHDAAMLHFSQWWRRQVRGGYGGLDVATRFGGGLFSGSIRSARVWGLGWPILLIVVTLIATGLGGWMIGSLAGGLIMLAWPLQVIRIACRTRRRGYPWKLSVMHGLLTMVGKWAALKGQWQYRRDRAAGRGAKLIEHKRNSASCRANL